MVIGDRENPMLRHKRLFKRFTYKHNLNVSPGLEPNLWVSGQQFWSDECVSDQVFDVKQILYSGKVGEHKIFRFNLVLS